MLAYFSAARTRDLPHSPGEFLTRSSRSASRFAASPSSMAYMLSWNVLSICRSIESSVSSTVSFTASRSVATACPGKPMPTLPCQPKCLMIAVSAFATVESSASSSGIVSTSSISSPVSVSTGAARSARALDIERRLS